MIKSTHKKVTNTVHRAQANASAKKRSLSKGKAVKSVSRAKSTKSASKSAMKSLKGGMSGAKNTVEFLTKNARHFIEKHHIEEGMKSALIEFIKKFKF